MLPDFGAGNDEQADRRAVMAAAIKTNKLYIYLFNPVIYGQTSTRIADIDLHYVINVDHIQIIKVFPRNTTAFSIGLGSNRFFGHLKRLLTVPTAVVAIM